MELIFQPSHGLKQIFQGSTFFCIDFIGRKILQNGPERYICTLFFHNTRYQYPLHDNVRENQAEDERCLANVEEHIEKQTKLGVPVAGMIVEPIQAEGGDYHGSKEFFQVISICFCAGT